MLDTGKRANNSMKNTTIDYTDEPIRIGAVVDDLFPKEIEFRFQGTLQRQNDSAVEKVNLALSTQVFEQLKIEANHQNISIATLLEQLITQGLSKIETKHPKVAM